jgi:hypothetical protein
LWVAFLDPSDSYFLFADLVGFYIQKHYPQYGIPIWCLWPNIRFLSSTVTEKNATKNILDGRTDRRTEVKHWSVTNHKNLNHFSVKRYSKSFNTI